MDTLISTGHAARLLGVSRQHVVDLCERGVLPSVRVGTHRRIALDAVQRLAGSRRLTAEEERSLWLHLAVVGALVTGPDAVIQKARENLSRWSGTQRRDGRTQDFMRQWEQLLDRDLDDVIEVLTSRSEDACELRQNSPFADVLTRSQRLAVLRSHAAYRDRDRAIAG